MSQSMIHIGKQFIPSYFPNAYPTVMYYNPMQERPLPTSMEKDTDCILTYEENRASGSSQRIVVGSRNLRNSRCQTIFVLR
ncbi:hypothetical protein CEXT_78301 [Caerostris extrusa]|uniref:Uncharacterized protein n=1 Tax=Caerostris extrusa TaxID=172846 RepID=A0AAV4RWU1_CAEEX|nr:hypothetical protein CEXT_78301 [Caerostris extrusa]